MCPCASSSALFMRHSSSSSSSRSSSSSSSSRGFQGSPLAVTSDRHVIFLLLSLLVMFVGMLLLLVRVLAVCQAAVPRWCLAS